MEHTDSAQGTEHQVQEENEASTGFGCRCARLVTDGDDLDKIHAGPSSQHF